MAKNYGKNALNALNFSICDIEPLTKSQLLAFDSEKHMILHGCAGTGKTFISFYIAFDDIIKGLYSNILVIRSAVPTRDIGYLPGNEEEKTRIYEEPYKDITKELFQRGDAYKTLREKGLIDFMRTFSDNSFLEDTAFTPPWWDKSFIDRLTLVFYPLEESQE